MATHSSILVCKIPWTEEPGGLQSVHGVPKESDITEHACNAMQKKKKSGSKKLDLLKNCSYTHDLSQFSLIFPWPLTI